MQSQKFLHLNSGADAGNQLIQKRSKLWYDILASHHAKRRVQNFDCDEAMTLGRAVVGLNAYSKGIRLGLFMPAPKGVKEKKQKQKLKEGEALHIELLGRAVSAVHTPDGLRAVSKDRPIAPPSVERYLEGKFGEALPAVRKAMETLTRSMPPETLAAEAFKLYE